MAWGKTEEEKRAALEAKQQQKREAAKKKAEAAYWASPVGKAQKARDRGDLFFQVDIPHSTVEGYSNLMWGEGDVSKTHQTTNVGKTIGEIEGLGWHLEHASWVFVETGTSSRDKVMASGQKTSTTGRVEGIYLFRRMAPA